MTRRLAPSVIVLLALLPSPPAPASAAAQQKSPISTAEEIKAEFAQVPCEDEARQAAVRALFEKAGAAPEQVSVEEYKDVQNVVVSKKGETDEKIVVGAHYDKVSGGCGAVDNWTGVVAIAHLYRTLRDARTKKTLVFVAFGKEERGLWGSKAMAKAIEKERVAEYCAMINLDSLGLSIPQVAENMSSRKLLKFTEELAKEMKMPFARAGIEGAASDSVPFVDKKIPAVTIHGLSEDWRDILHSGHDQVKKVNPESVYLGYRLTLAMIVRLDAADCAAYK